MMQRAQSLQGWPVDPNTAVTFSSEIPMDRSLTAHPMIYSSEAPYAPALQNQFPVGLDLPTSDDVKSAFQVYDPVELARQHGPVDEGFSFSSYSSAGGPSWNLPVTPDLATDESSYYSSAMSRSTSMVSAYMPGTAGAQWPPNTEANDLFVPYKMQFAGMGLGFDNPIASPDDQFLPAAGYAFSANGGADQDVLFSPVHAMDRSMSSTTTSSIYDPLTSVALPSSSATTADDEPRHAPTSRIVRLPAPANKKMEIPRAKHLSSRALESGHQGLRCDKCNRNPDGFRGDHELMRHKRLFHARAARKWVCVDLRAEESVEHGADWAAPQLPLEQCPNCRNGKQYGQYYNAAAHLRRYHFHPKPRGRPKGDARPRRAGSAGGHEPSIAVLKKYWLRAVNVVNRAEAGGDYDDEADGQERGVEQRRQHQDEADDGADEEEDEEDEEEQEDEDAKPPVFYRRFPTAYEARERIQRELREVGWEAAAAVAADAAAALVKAEPVDDGDVSGGDAFAMPEWQPRAREARAGVFGGHYVSQDGRYYAP